jgi:hypothetical protein
MKPVEKLISKALPCLAHQHIHPEKQVRSFDNFTRFLDLFKTTTQKNFSIFSINDSQNNRKLFSPRNSPATGLTHT